MVYNDLLLWALVILGTIVEKSARITKQSMSVHCHPTYHYTLSI